MEQRQTQIREGAGLEESRLNTEFIEWMQRYSAPLLVAIAVVAGGYAGWNYLKRQREQGQDKAFVELQNASSARSPISLVRVAEEHSSRGAVPALARLAAADLRLEAFRTGVKAGLQLKPDGSLPEGEKLLSDDERAAELTNASELYKQVLSASERTPSAALLTIGAWSGLASISECQGKFEDAATAYQKVIAAATASGYDDLATLAQKRIDSLGKLNSPAKLYAAADLPKKLGGVNPGSPGGSERLMRVKMGPDGKMQLAPEDDAVPGAPDAAPPTAPASTDPAGTAPNSGTSPAPTPAPPSDPKPADKPGSGTPNP